MYGYFTPSVSFLDVNVGSLRSSIDGLKNSLNKRDFNDFMNSLIRDEDWIDPYKNNLWSEVTPNRGYYDNLEAGVNAGYTLCSLILTYQNLEKSLKSLKSSYDSAISNRSGAYQIISQANRIKMQLNNILQQINNLINRIQTASRTNAHLDENFTKLKWEFKDVDNKKEKYEDIKTRFNNAASKFASSYARTCSNRYVSRYAGKITDNFSGGKRVFNKSDEVWVQRKKAIRTIDEAGERIVDRFKTMYEPTNLNIKDIIDKKDADIKVEEEYSATGHEDHMTYQEVDIKNEAKLEQEHVTSMTNEVDVDNITETDYVKSAGIDELTHDENVDIKAEGTYSDNDVADIMGDSAAKNETLNTYNDEEVSEVINEANAKSADLGGTYQTEGISGKLEDGQTDIKQTSGISDNVFKEEELSVDVTEGSSNLGNKSYDDGFTSKEIETDVTEVTSSMNVSNMGYESRGVKNSINSESILSSDVATRRVA